MPTRFVKQSPLLKERLGALSVRFAPGPPPFTDKSPEPSDHVEEHPNTDSRED